ncbi:SDR family oxidoreductase [Candidatus Woesebacteria bacterium]|nr:SDR family oxidoreductase [Candidatus Woesebacteria bacterium]
MNLKNKTILITGATGGIGSVLAQKLSDLGANVITIGRDQKKVASYHADLADRASRQKLVDTLLSNHTNIDFVIHAAGIAIDKPFSDISQQDWEQSYMINVESPYFITQGLLPILKNSRIIVIGSKMGVIPTAGRSAYCAHKFALRGLTLALAEEYRDTKILFQHITLGPVMTNFGGRTIMDRQHEAKQGKAFFTPVWVADKLIEIMQDDGHEDEITLFPKSATP